MNTTRDTVAPAIDDAPDHGDSDIRPLITRHRLRRRRRRTAATLLAGASIALGAAAMRSTGASAHAPVATPVTDASPLSAASEQPPAPVASRSVSAGVPTTEPSTASSTEPIPDASALEAPPADSQPDDEVRISR